MIKQKIDFISTESIYGSSYKKFPSNSGGFTWGYADKEVFRKAIELTADKTQQPRLDIYMTLATHDPFLVPDQSYYNDKFRKRLKQIGLNENDESYVNDMKKYAAILYMDDAIKYLINSYSKREDFQNTIFIITGDHRMAEIPLISKIDKYHVPLIIYSPLLKKAEKFEAVSSHLDITPTIIAFLKNNYSLKFPSKVHWLGKGIDFNKSFRNIHSLAFMWDKSSTYNYLYKDYFINQNTLFKLSKDMNIDPIKSDSIFNIVYAMLNNFKEKNKIVCFNNKLYPENIDDSRNDNVNVKENEKANEQTNTINNNNYKESEIISLKEFTNNFENNYKNNKKISNRKAFSGQYSMRIEPKNNKEIILDSILIKELFQNINLLLNFKIFPLPFSKNYLPELMIEIYDANNLNLYKKQIKLTIDKEISNNKGKWMLADLKENIIMPALKTDEAGAKQSVAKKAIPTPIKYKAAYLRLSLINIKKAEIFYDDLSIKIIGEK